MVQECSKRLPDARSKIHPRKQSQTLTELVDFTAAKARQTEQIWQTCTLLCVRLSLLKNFPTLTFPGKQQGLLGDP